MPLFLNRSRFTVLWLAKCKYESCQNNKKTCHRERDERRKSKTFPSRVRDQEPSTCFHTCNNHNFIFIRIFSPSKCSFPSVHFVNFHSPDTDFLSSIRTFFFETAVIATLPILFHPIDNQFHHHNIKGRIDIGKPKRLNRKYKMANFRFLFFLLSSWNIFICHRSASAFLPTTISSSATTKSHLQSRILPQYPNASFFTLHATFEQRPGENTTDFIKRITNESNELLNKQKKGWSPDDADINKGNSNDNDSKPVGKYQRIEEWDAERTAKGELSWEEKVQFEGQKYGNQLKQDSILRRHLGTFR
jgi:hypothetical protein